MGNNSIYEDQKLFSLVWINYRVLLSSLVCHDGNETWKVG